MTMLAFGLKAGVFRLRRSLLDAFGGPRRHPVRDGGAGTLLSQTSAPLRPQGDEDPAGEALLIDGKIENLRIALRRLDGAVVPANATFGFWRQIGRAARDAGYVEGRELREGCIVPSVGGGLCLLSNALYGAALDAGCEIVERHAHSHVVPGSLTERDRDATVFWNYVDLRFRTKHELTIRAYLTADRLVVRLHGTPMMPGARARASQAAPILEGPSARSCASCGIGECARHREPVARAAQRSAFFVDAYWPEYDAFIAVRATLRDVLCLPIDGRRFKRPQYAWTASPFGTVRQFPIAMLRRSVRSRALATRGAALQRALLHESRRLAVRYARELAPDIDHVVVAQTLVPFLWRAGHLGGRTFDVLMTNVPMGTLQERLDEAAARHPESPTLADFRAGAALVRAETEALAGARRIVTPHAEIARMFGERAERLRWSEPVAAPIARTPSSRKVLFAGSTLGRSGSYEMRAAARRMGFSLLVAGDDRLEGPHFWSGIDVTFVGDFRRALALASVVAHCAYVERRPRRLLEALAAGVPVIASNACGLDPRAELTLIPPGDVDALCAALEAALAPQASRAATAGMP
jgi:hypothetical protein